MGADVINDLRLKFGVIIAKVMLSAMASPSGGRSVM